MLEVKTPEEVLRLIGKEFQPLGSAEYVSLIPALGRVLAEDIRAEEYVPDFDRSTVDGYALHAKDTFGCSDSVPAILNLAGEVRMGEEAKVAIRNIRRDANDKIKEMKKNSEINEDEQKQSEKLTQDLTDKYIKEIDKVTEEKEKEIMEI